jgi:hypothetical protein
MDSSNQPLQLLCIGGSHLRCIVDAAEDAADELQARGIRIHALKLTEPKYKPTLEGGKGKHPHVQPRLKRDIEQLQPECDGVYLSVGGNAHNALGLVESERPFDFVLDSEPDLPLLPDREVVPSASVRAALLATKRFSQQMLARKLILELVGDGAVHMDIPPPINDEKHIRANCGAFVEEVLKYGIAPPLLRYKLWRLYSDMVREQCDEVGAEVLPVPPATIDNGYLVRQAFTTDPTHAGTWYGRRVIEQIVQRHRPGFTMQEAEK